jgi:Flp pilus assembly protein TadD
VADTPRIEELRRRVEKDPASIVFAQLAEELRRAGDDQDAIRVCRAGLAHHPAYLSARVTLGRALLAAGQLEAARTELERVVQAAPDNLAARRALADVDRQRQPGGAPAAAPPPLPDSALTELEGWLEAIVEDRRARRQE